MENRMFAVCKAEIIAHSSLHRQLLEVMHMLSLSTSLRSGWVANMDRNRVIKINGLNYELHLTSPTKARLSYHRLVAGTPELINVINIPLSRIELESMFDAKTAALILRVAEELGA
jgi:hypothetical protein